MVIFIVVVVVQNSISEPLSTVEEAEQSHLPYLHAFSTLHREKMIQSLTSYKREDSVKMLNAALDQLGAADNAEQTMSTYKEQTDQVVAGKIFFVSFLFH